MRIEQTKKTIMDIENLLKALDHQLSIMDTSHDDSENKLLEVRFEENQRQLKLYHRQLQQYMQMRDELTAERDN